MTALREHPNRLNSAGPRHDGTGISITTTDTELLGADDAQGLLDARYPISVEYGEPALPA